MGAKSTIDITRSQALHFVTDVLHEVDDETLARVVEELNDYLQMLIATIPGWKCANSLGLHNFQIVNKEDK